MRERGCRPLGGAGPGRAARRRIGLADTFGLVPGVPALDKWERSTREDSHELLVGVQDLEQGDQIMLVRAASVQEDHCARRLVPGGPETVDGEAH